MGKDLTIAKLMEAGGVGRPTATRIARAVRGKPKGFGNFLHGEADAAEPGFQSQKAAQRAEQIAEDAAQQRRQDGFMDNPVLPYVPEVADQEEEDEPTEDLPTGDDVVAETYPNHMLVRLKKRGMARKGPYETPVGLTIPESAIWRGGGHWWLRGRPRTRSKW